MTATGTMADQDHAVPMTMMTSPPPYTAVDVVADKPSLFQFQRPYARTPKAKHAMEAMTLALGTLCTHRVADLTMTKTSPLAQCAAPAMEVAQSPPLSMKVLLRMLLKSSPTQSRSLNRLNTTLSQATHTDLSEMLLRLLILSDRTHMDTSNELEKALSLNSEEELKRPIKPLLKLRENS